MKRTLLVALALALTSIAAPTSPATAHDAPKRCGQKPGGGAGWYKVRAHGFGCMKARRLAQRWETKCVANSNCPGEPDHINSVDPGFKCWHRKAGYESVRVQCHPKSGDGQIHFLWGS